MGRSRSVRCGDRCWDCYERIDYRLVKTNMQIVVVDNPDIQQEVDMVYADLERMTKTVLELFLENGHKRIAYIGGYKVDMDEFGGKQISINERGCVPISIL